MADAPDARLLDPHADLLARLTDVRQRLQDAADAAGRDPSTVRLVAVSKTAELESVRAAAAAGQRDFGESRVQEGLSKMQRPTLRSGGT